MLQRQPSNRTVLAAETTLKLSALSAFLATTLSISSLDADNRLLFDAHHSAGLSCAQCHDERPPKVSPSVDKCLSCHGDQQSLARKTEQTFPNPHASPHAAPGEVQVCADCHHVHRPSEVTCSSCHREFFFNVK
ncbi:cytochrome c3 family protein [Bradyrhizobium sp. USDA 10063]